MLEILSSWYKRYFSDPQAVMLTVILIVGFTVVLTMGKMLTPVLAAMVIAYLLEGIVRHLEQRGVQRLMAVILVFIIFFAFFRLFLAIAL